MTEYLVAAEDALAKYLVTDHGVPLGFQEYVSGGAVSFIDSLLRVIESRPGGDASREDLVGYLLAYAAYSFPEIVGEKLEQLYGRFLAAVKSRHLRSVLVERLFAIKRYEISAKQRADALTITAHNLSLGPTVVAQDFQLFVLTTKAAQARHIKLSANIVSLGLQATLFFNTAKADISAVPPSFFFDAVPGEIAANVGHHRIWEMIQENQVDLSLVLEDDVVLSHCPENIRELMAPDVDLVFVNNRVLPLSEDSSGTDRDSTESRLLPVWFGCGADGYFVTLQGAQKLLRIFERNCGVVDMQLLASMQGSNVCPDIREKLGVIPQLKCFRLYPFMIDHPVVNHSEIHGIIRRNFAPGLWLA